MLRTRCISCTLCLLFCGWVLPPALAQQAPATNYPDSPDGLGKLMGDLVAAAKTNSVRERQLVAGLRLADAPAWFEEVFGPDYGPELATSYRLSEAELDGYTSGLFEYCVKSGVTEIKVEQLGTPQHPIFSERVLTAMVHPVPLYRVSFRAKGHEVATSNNYVYAQGGFRRVSDDVFMALPGMPSARIRIADYRPKGSQVRPIPPTDAAGKPMHGTVLLKVLIDTKGEVKTVKLEKGDPMLGQAATEAVRQWHFEPLAVAGNPLEVETTVSVHFP